MTHRQRTIQTLLERLNELADPMQTRSGQGGDGPPLMPRTYTPSVRELERLLRVMREDRSEPLLHLTHGGETVSVRSCWWHLNARYMTSTQATKTRTVHRKTKHHKTVAVAEARIVTYVNGRELSINADGEERLEPHVQRGIVWLADNWNLKTEPMIPSELRVSA